MAIESLNNNQNLLSLFPTSDLSTKRAEETNKSNKVNEIDEQAASSIGSSYKQDSDTAAVYEKKSNAESPYDEKRVNDILSESDLNASNFSKLVENLMTKQTEQFNLANSQDNDANKVSENNQNNSQLQESDTSKIQSQEKTRAQEDVSENGYYSVQNTSDRILEFAKSLAGDDADKLEEMDNAFEEGYNAAANKDDEELSEISKETYDNVKQGFENLKNDLSQKAQESADVQAAQATQLNNTDVQSQRVQQDQAAQNQINNNDQEEPSVAIQSISNEKK